MKRVIIGDDSVRKVVFGNDLPISLICGPCAIESYDLAMQTGEMLKNISDELDIGIVYKSSFDKANRTSIKANRGVGIEEGLKILEKVRAEFKLPIITDIHTEEQIKTASSVVDILQIPSLLSRQTDIIVAAAKSGKPVNIKKGQFLAPEDMKNVATKALEETDDILLTERGVVFGYNNLVSDMRSLRIMAKIGSPVIFDATHSVQIPGGAGDSTSGKRIFVEPLARAAVSVGVAGLFIESHPNPDDAISDGPNMVPMGSMKELLKTLMSIDSVAKECSYVEAIR